MSITSPDARISEYNPVVATTEFAAGFPVFDNDDISVFHDGVERDDFAVTATYDQGISTNAKAVFANGITGLVQVVGARDPHRTNRFQNGGPLPVRDVNLALDTIESEMQEARRDISRALLAPYGETPPNTDEVLEAAEAAVAAANSINQRIYTSKAIAAADTIPAIVTRLRTQFYAPVFSTAATMVGGANYKRISFADLGGFPARSYFRSFDRFMPDGTTDVTNGGYWVLDETRISVSMVGAIPGDTAGNLLAAFQAAIDFLPSGGGVIGVPDGDFSALVASSLSVGNKAVTFDCRNRTTDLPANMPGVIHRNHRVAIPESGLTGSVRDVRVHNHYQVLPSLANAAVRQYVHHVEAFLPAGLTGVENELRAYSFDVGTDTANDQHDIRGMKGRVWASAGNGNLRAIYGYAESSGSHTGILTGLIGTVARDTGTGEAIAVRGHVQPGTSFSGSSAFQAAGNGASRDASFGFAIRGGSGGALNCKTACFSGHGGGGGNLIQQYVDAVSSTVNYRVDSLGKETLFSVRSNTVSIADDAALTIAPPIADGGVWVVITDSVSAGTGIFAFRASGAHLLTDIGTRGALLTMSTASIPTGTTGPDGNANLFCNSGNLYIENRSGAARSFTWLFIGK